MSWLIMPDVTAPVPFQPNERIVDVRGLALVPFTTKLNNLQRRVGELVNAAEADAQDAGAISVYTAGGPISAPRVLMTVDGSRTVQHADPSSWPNAARIVGISVVSASGGAEVRVRWLGPFEYDGWSWDLTKRIFCGLDGQLTQTAPTSGFVRCVGQPITPTSMRVDIDAPIFRS